jgi:hypothetical protein
LPTDEPLRKRGPKSLIDLTGRTFGKLQVLRRATYDEIMTARFPSWKPGHRQPRSTNTTSAWWIVVCTCGTTKPVPSANLRNASTRSCGAAQCRNVPSRKSQREGP